MSPRARVVAFVALAVAALIAIFLLLRSSATSTTQPDLAGASSKGASSDRPVTAPSGPASAIVFAPSTSSSITPSPSNVIATLGWGTGPNELGRLKGHESNPEGPMSLAVGADGTIAILDQVNGRVVRLDRDGKVIGTFAISLNGAQDLAIAKNGDIAVLDRLADKKVSIVGADGSVKGTLPLEGPGVPESGAVTGVFADGNDVYVEREHAVSVLLGDLAGNGPETATEIPGRPTRDGKAWISAWLEPPLPTSLVYVTSVDRASDEHLFTRQFDLQMAISGLVLLDADAAGIIYVGAFGGASEESTQEIVLFCLEPTGAPLGMQTLPASELPEETFRTMAVQASGGVIYSYMTEAGVQLMRADCR